MVKNSGTTLFIPYCHTPAEESAVIKKFSGCPWKGMTLVVIVAVSVVFCGCTSPADQQIPAVTEPPGGTPNQAPDTTTSTPAPAGTVVNSSLPYGVTISVPADWTRQDVMAVGVRDYGTATENIANFYSPPALLDDRSSYITLSVDFDRIPERDFEKYFNNATVAVQKTAGALTHVEVRSSTLKIAGYKSYKLDFLTEQVKGTYIFTSTEYGMYIFTFRVPNKPRAVEVFNSAVRDMYTSIRINHPVVDVTPYR